MRAAVVIPIYKPFRADLEWYERISLERCLKVLGHHPLIFIAPEGREFDYLPSGSTVETFDPRYFKSRNGYNALMLNPYFYERLLDYEYILIYQLDAFVFSDRLEEFCRLGYDYIGAPWILGAGRQKKQFLIVDDKGFFTVGNGGFSLRNAKACADILKNNIKTVRTMNVTEDFIFAYLGQKYPQQFKVAPILTASRFSCERLAERYCRKNENVLPFGCHGWNRNSAKFYIRVFEEFGYDLAPHKHLLKSDDLLGKKVILLHEHAKRLRIRLNKGYSMIKYLPSNEQFYVFAINSAAAPLLQKLYDEGLQIINADNIPFLNSDEQIKAVAEVLRLTDQRGLLLCTDDNSEAVVSELIKLGGLQYGRDFISLWRESANRTAALLRRISRPTVKRLTNLGLY